jgi:hypothetical protein
VTGWKKGDRVVTPDGPGTIVGPWLSRGLKPFGDLREDGWIVAQDSGKRRVHVHVEPEPDERGT